MHNTNPILLTILLVGLLFVSCSKDDPADPDPNAAAFKGDFVSAVHQTSGSASIDKDETTLSLINFKTDSGPDLNIYLVSSISNVVNDYIDLGDLKGTDGSYAYDLPDNVDYTDYKYVVVWCVAFNVNFGYAELVAQ